MERNESNITYLLPENLDHCCRIGSFQIWPFQREVERERERERDIIITNWANATQCSLSRKYLSDSKNKISDSGVFCSGHNIKAYKRQKNVVTDCLKLTGFGIRSPVLCFAVRNSTAHHLFKVTVAATRCFRSLKELLQTK